MWSCATSSASSFSSLACFSDLIMYTPSRQLCSSADTQILGSSNAKTKTFGQSCLFYCIPKRWNLSCSCLMYLCYSPSPFFTFLLCAHMCVCARNAILYNTILEYKTVIYYFGGFDVIIIVDLVKCSVLTLVVEVGAMQITAIIIKRESIF